MNAEGTDRDHGPSPHISTSSRFGLNAANFFQAEAVGVLLPVLDGFLRDAHWRYGAIGVATSLAGLGTFLFQTPAGIITDRIRYRRRMFACVSLLVGACFVLVPLVPSTDAWLDPLLFFSGMVQSFFAPLLGALALALVGHAALGHMIGENQSWNHAGNIVAAVTAMALTGWLGTDSVFYAVAVASTLGALSVFLVRSREMDEARGSGRKDGVEARKDQSWRNLLRNRNVLCVLAAISLFHLANAPILPMTALYVKHLGGSDSLMTATVLIAQVVMVPVAWVSGRLCQSWGRKPVMAIGFWILPLRIASYTLAPGAKSVVALQALDGVGAGIYGVVAVAMAADLTQGKGKFNTLMGMLATAQALGGVAGPVCSGYLIQYLGFKPAFWSFAVLALAAALVFTVFVPETRDLEKRPVLKAV